MSTSEKGDVTDQIATTWTNVLGAVMRQVPDKIREQVLTALLKKETARQAAASGFDFTNIGKLGSWTAEDERGFRVEKEVASLLVQVLTRSITNNVSKEDAAKILFRDHYGRGTGSGWLPDYLDGLPGITVDKAKCVAIADSAGPSKLKDAANG